MEALPVTDSTSTLQPEHAQASDDREQRELFATREILNEIVRSGTRLDRVLAIITARTRLITEATGAAIALADGAGIVCKAASGNLAPPLGAPLDESSGISGACLRTGQVVRCDDIESDSRVDSKSCRDGIRSVIAAPLLMMGSVVGLVEVFSNRPNAFGNEEVATLQRVATLLAAAVARAGCPSVVIDSPDGESASPQVSDEFSVTPQSKQHVQLVPYDSFPAYQLEAQGASDDVAFAGESRPDAAFAATRSFADPLPSHAMFHEPLPGQGPEKEVASAVTVPLSDELQTQQISDFESEEEPTKRFSRRQLSVAVAVMLMLILALLWFSRSKPIARTSTASGVLTGIPEPQSPAALPASDGPDAAETGDADAQFVLGSRYLAGKGVNQDYSEAAKWFALAARRGHVASQSMLGTLYFAGRGVPKDNVMAYMWSSIAAQNGDPLSKERLPQLKRYMSSGELAEAQHRTEEWLSKYRYLGAK